MRALELPVRLAVAAALTIDAVVHLRLASNYQLAAPGGIGGGNLFRVQAVAAILIGIYLLVRPSRLAYAVAALVLLSAFFAVLLYRYVEVPSIGPIPSMYEPIWYAEKAVSAVAEGFGALLAIVGVALSGRTARERNTETSSAR
ncbi:MAG: hypothetical protein ACR2FV_07035 [Ornithinimicrobium sp.]|jgi:hypothetical protein|uniref:hypothetical protein n=1 Tax=Ornithinimicrobium sp. TaxID=1977084 RepID=UPI0017D56B4C|nr:hypothetical protein [Actinomycetota bacterium]